MKNLVVYIGVLALTACAVNQNQWEKEGSLPAEFDSVSQQCKVKAESQSQTMLQQVVISYVNCLESQGWRPANR